MKRIFTILIIVFQFTTVQSQDSYLEWADGMGGSGSDIGHSIITDASGNVYVTGSFQGVVDFDPGIGTTSLVSNGGSDIFVQKLDSNGNLLWVKSMGGVGLDFGLSIAVDVNGDIYVTGSFEDTVNFNPNGITTNLISNGNYDAFVQKLDTNGNLLWVKSIGGNLFDLGRAISTDLNGYIYITGSFQDTVDFDPGVGVTNLISAGGDDIYVLKLNASSGNFIWANSMGGVGNDGGLSIVNQKATGEVFVTGFFEGTANFISTNITSAGGKDLFILKIDMFDNVEFAQSFGMSGNDLGNAITLSSSNDIILTGIFDGNIMVLKYDYWGALDWINIYGVSSGEGKSIITDAVGNIYVTGKFRGNVNFNPTNIGGYLNSNGSDDVFVQKLDASGNYIWAKSIGGILSDVGNSISLDQSSNNIYITGSFVGTVDFDPNTGITNLISNSSLGIFVLKLGQCVSMSSAFTITVCDSYTSPSGNYTWTSTGIYTDVIQGPAPNCTNIITITVIVDNGISTAISNFSPTLISGEPSASSYQWIDCNTMLPVLGDTNQSFTPTINGSYAVVLTKNGCTDTSVCATVTNVGLDENSLSSTISIYPSPTSNQLTIDSKQVTIDAIKIIDVTGKIIKTINPNTNTIDIKDIPKGIYFIQIKEDKKVVMKKFVKE